jgi:hypothetical protein
MPNLSTEYMTTIVLQPPSEFSSVCDSGEGMKSRVKREVVEVVHVSVEKLCVFDYHQ